MDLLSLITLLDSLLEGGTRCEMLLVRTIIGMQLTGSGPVRFIPMMVTRMTISLKKVASSQQPYLDMDVPSGLPTDLEDNPSPRTAGGIRLSILGSGRV